MFGVDWGKVLVTLGTRAFLIAIYATLAAIVCAGIEFIVGKDSPADRIITENMGRYFHLFWGLTMLLVAIGGCCFLTGILLGGGV